MLRLRAVAAVIPMAVLLAPAPAGAYTFIGHWPSHTVLYYDASPYHRQVRAAAAAWNHSGARVRWVAVPRRRARVIIRLDPKLPIAGLAFSNSNGTGWIRLQKHLGTPSLGPFGTLTMGEQVVAHEMGHVIGLGHETHRCAVMAPNLDSKGPPRCPLVKELWRRRCRLLERDDIAGAVRRFGGRVKLARGSPFCPVGPAPAAPTNPQVTESAPGSERFAVKLTWRNPARRKDGTVEITRRAGTCPRGLGDPKATPVTTSVIGGDREQTGIDEARGLTPGRWCYLFVTKSGLGQPGKAATAWLDYHGQPPSAHFDAEASDTDPNTIVFTDLSSDLDGTVVAWSWNLGDGATGTGQSVTHRYAAPGTYTVTLTVTDNGGATASTSDTVQIEAPDPEE